MQIKVQQNMATRGSYVHNSMVDFSGTSQKFLTIFSKSSWFQTKWFTGLLELIQLCKQNPLEKIFIFTIYQNYTLALRTLSGFQTGLPSRMALVSIIFLSPAILSTVASWSMDLTLSLQFSSPSFCRCSKGWSSLSTALERTPSSLKCNVKGKG